MSSGRSTHTPVSDRIIQKRKELRKRKTFKKGGNHRSLWRRRYVLMKTLDGDITVLTWVRADEDHPNSDSEPDPSPPEVKKPRLTSPTPSSRGSSVPKSKPLPKQSSSSQKPSGIATKPALSLYTCSVCGAVLKDSVAFKKHARVHQTREHVCEVDGCGKAFVERSKLKRHMMVHTGERPHQCPYADCKKDFGLDYNLRKHIQAMHSGDQLQCPRPGCTNRYMDENALKQHLASHILEEQPLKIIIKTGDEFFK
eukprot:216224_1